MRTNQALTKFFAHILSVLFHPLVMPTYGLIFIFSVGPFLSFLPFDAKKLIVLVVSINTLALPLLMIPLFKRFGIIKSIHMTNRRERLIPMAFTLIPYILSFYFLHKLPIPSVVQLFVLSAIITLIFTFIITIWWKISIHMVAIGGLLGLTFSFSLLFQADVLVIFALFILAAGLIAWARLWLKAHSPLQIYAGLALGWISTQSIIMLL